MYESNLSRSLLVVAAAAVAVVLGVTSPSLASTKGSGDTIHKTIGVTGEVADMAQRTNAAGMAFQIGFRGIRYQGQIEQAVIEQRTEGRVIVKLGLRNIQLMISSTNISGNRHGANCGPMKVTLGTRRELWLTMELAQTTVDGEPQFKIVSSDFQLAADNWTVGAPSWVKTWGLGMTQNKVVSGLRTGLMDNRKSVEQLLIKECPDLMAQIEQLLHEHLAVNQLAAR